MKKVDAMHRLGSLTGFATVMMLVGSAALSAQPPAATQATAVSPQGYSVVLVLGDLQGTSATDNNVPAAARKALADMKDFLPYKSYRLLDAQWILGSQKTVSRLRGPNDQEYELSLRGIQISGGKLSVAFRLAEPGALLVVKPSSPDADSKSKRGELEKGLREAEAEAARARGSSAEKRAETVGAAREKTAAILKELQQENALREAATRVGGRAIIDTSFTMDVGETVVVGTSRVAGEKALIALLTAVGHTGR